LKTLTQEQHKLLKLTSFCFPIVPLYFPHQTDVETGLSQRGGNRP